MKRVIISIIAISLFFSCNVDDESERVQTTETTIEGHVSDVERNIDIEGFRVVVGRISFCGSWFTAGPCTEIIETAYTDVYGNYSLTFDYIHGEEYVFIKQYYGTPYYTEYINPIKITKGADNVRNINAWYPTVLKLGINVTNNDFTPLRVRNEIIGRDNLHFGHASIYETNIDTIIYQRTRPNSDVELMFYYSTGYSNENAHRYFEDITTTLQDTISLSYNIDCSSF